ncbi:MAG: hypothetical protein WKH64_18430 [Chloroflexia bacterium]
MFADDEARWWEVMSQQRDARAIHVDARIDAELIALPEIAPTIRVLWDEGQLPQQYVYDNAGNQSRVPFGNALSHLARHPFDAVRAYLTETGSFTSDIDAARLEAAFVAVQQRLSPTHPVDVIASAPLKHFDMPLDKVAFPDGAAIERMSGADKATLWNDDYLSETFKKSELASTKFRLVARYRRTRETAHSGSEAQERFARILSAMRLLQPSIVNAPTIVLEEVPREPPGGMSAATQLRDTSTLTFLAPGEYKLDPTSVSLLLELDRTLGTLATNRSNTAFNLALRRYNQSYERGFDEDTLIDLAITLESTLLFEGKQELRYRLAVRGAALLWEINDPQSTYELLMRLYDVRSNIVHNGQLLAAMKPKFFGGMQPSEFVWSARQYVCAILREYLRLLSAGEGLSEVNSALDQRIVAALRPASWDNVPPTPET